MEVLRTVIAATIGIGVLLMMLGVIGRRRGDEPHCARCGTDARRFAWTDPPRCSCGASLERFGSVRTGTWRRSMRLMILGAVTASLGIGGIIAANGMLQNGNGLERLAPWWLLVSRLSASDAWASTELRRRASEDLITTAQATQVATLFEEQPSLAATRWYQGTLDVQLRASLLRKADRSDRRLHELIAASTLADGAATAGPLKATRGQDLSVFLLSTTWTNPIEPFARIDRVLVDGQPATWRWLSDGEDVAYRATDDRLLGSGGVIRVRLPPGIALGTHTLTVGGEFGQIALVAVALLQEALRSDEAARGQRMPIAAWGVPAFGSTLTHTVPFEVIAGPDEPSSEPSPERGAKGEGT